MGENEQRLLGKMEQGIETLATGQATMISDLKDHRREMFELHASTANRVSEVEADVERVETKINGHADEDNKRFTTMRWVIGGLVGLFIAVAGAFQALAQ